MAPWLVLAVHTPPSLHAAPLQPKGARLVDKRIFIPRKFSFSDERRWISPAEQRDSGIPAAVASQPHASNVTVPGEPVEIEPITPRFDGCRRRLHQVSQTPPSDQETLVIGSGSNGSSNRSSHGSNGRSSRSSHGSNGSSGSSANAWHLEGAAGLFPADAWDLDEAAATGAQVRVFGPAAMVTRGVTPAGGMPSGAMVSRDLPGEITWRGMPLTHDDVTWSAGPDLSFRSPEAMQEYGDGCTSATRAAKFPVESNSLLGKLLLQCSTGRHVVQRGEWAARIARRYGVTLTDLSRANPSLRLGKLVPGQTINLPATARPTGDLSTALCACVQSMHQAFTIMRSLVITVLNWIQHEQQQLWWRWQEQRQHQRWQQQGQQKQVQEYVKRVMHDDFIEDDESADEEEEALCEWPDAETNSHEDSVQQAHEEYRKEGAEKAGGEAEAGWKGYGREGGKEHAMRPFASRTQLLMERWIQGRSVQQWVSSVSPMPTSPPSPSPSSPWQVIGKVSLHTHLLLLPASLLVGVGILTLRRQHRASIRK
ncbi:hypothetical protein CLOM_g1924 [Closterium sp. NIES-68]|nr:hypothetical protein CLOM_g1924 [Closterium sp. NIES-68]GJP78935.1 hypothetical protein CLOP_g9194 [Closterium sp. NIES-67]GJP82484.1 hypothetical protein CLOP_g12739 [Closterium sp. NIES-67]